MWPKLKNLKARHKPIVERYQRMHVGVVRLTGEQVSYPIPSDAELREENLRRLPLFSLDRMRSGTAQYRTRYFNEWEPMDLGKRMRFELKQNRQPFETQPLLDAPTVVKMLMDRMNPEHSDFDERVAGLIQSIDLKSPTEFIITFERVPRGSRRSLRASPSGQSGGSHRRKWLPHRGVRRRSHRPSDVRVRNQRGCSNITLQKSSSTSIRASTASFIVAAGRDLDGPQSARLARASADVR